MKVFARRSEERIKWRILDYFKVLPTNPDYQNLTDEQILLIVAHLVLDKEEAKNQKADHSETFVDEAYDEWEEEQMREIDYEIDYGVGAKTDAYF